MATRTRDSAPGREKRGTSPQKATKSSSPARTKNDSEKHIPNYLKSTVSSSRDASNSKEQGKKPVTSTTNITRRRSLDSTPSPSRTQKTRVSPNPTLRSSGKTVTSQKPVHDKSLKPTKGTTLYARPVGSAKNSTVKKQTNVQTSTSTTSTTKEQFTSPPEEVGAPVTPPEPETQVEDQESPITAQDVIDVEKNMILEDEAPINNEQSEVESENDANIPPKVLEPEDVSLGVSTEKSEEKSPIEEEEQENISNEINSNMDNDTNEEVQDEAKIMDNKEGDQVVAIESETGEMNETEVQEVDDEMEKKETEAPKQVILTGKKDSAVSNNVIEETASKLREQRKNKVKALAGAFETVISQQDPSNNNS